jgi:hypothetical protein
VSLQQGLYENLSFLGSCSKRLLKMAIEMQAIESSVPPEQKKKSKRLRSMVECAYENQLVVMSENEKNGKKNKKKPKILIIS